MYAIVLLLAFLGNGPPRTQTIGFDSSPVGALPQGWADHMTHRGAPPRWQVSRDDSAPSRPNVLAQLSSDRTAGRFPLAIFNGALLKDGTLSVCFKPVSGVVDQAAGIVWRYQDPDNYYIARANALENNVVLYKVEKGLRSSIAPKGLPSRSYGVKHVIAKRQWSTLRIEIQASRFTVYLNGERLFEAEDKTFQAAGKVGLWTKADSVIYFDNFTISTSSGEKTKP
jgi:hypothetical protein